MNAGDRLGQMLRHYDDGEHEDVCLQAGEILDRLAPALVRAVLDLVPPPAGDALSRPAGPVSAAGVAEAFRARAGDALFRPCGRGRCAAVDDAARCGSWSDLLGRAIVPESFPQEGEERLAAGLALFFLIHSTGYGRWEDSFDYDHIGCLLSAGRQAALRFREGVLGAPPGSNTAQGALFEALEYQSVRVHHQALIENGMIANDPLAMKHHVECFLECSGRMAEALDRSASALGQNPPGSVAGGETVWLGEFVEGLRDYVRSTVGQHEGLRHACEMLHLQQVDRARFLAEYPAARGEIDRCLARLEEGPEADCQGTRLQVTGIVGPRAFHPLGVRRRRMLVLTLGGRSAGFSPRRGSGRPDPRRDGPSLLHRRRHGGRATGGGRGV